MSKNVTLLPLGETLRRRRLERGLSLDDAAAELGISARTLRAVEWGRADLLPSPNDADRIEREYAVFLGLADAPAPTVETAAPLPEAAEPAPKANEPSGTHWVDRYGQPLALVAIGIVVAVGVFLLLSQLA